MNFMDEKNIIICLSVMILLMAPRVGFSTEGKIPESATSFPLEVDAKVSLSLMTSLVDLHVEKIMDCLDVLILSGEVQSGDWKKMKPLLKRLKKKMPPSVIWFARPDGSYNTVEKDLTDKNLKDRSYFPTVMAGGKVVGALVFSKSTGRKSFIVAVPVKVGEKVVGMLGASVFLEEFNQIIMKNMNLPENTLFFTLNAKANTVLNWKRERIFLDPTRQGSPSMAKAIREMLSQEEGVVEYEFQGKTRKVIFLTSKLTGWHFALGRIKDK